mgnify:CR=1 FL=1
MIETLCDSGQPPREWGRAVDGTPLLTVRAGGDKPPAIFITTGAYPTETAGVHATLTLLLMINTKHEAHLIPRQTREGAREGTTDG